MTPPHSIDRRTMLTAGAAMASTPWVAIAAPPANGMVDGAAIRADLAIFEAAYAALHPGLDRYLGRAAFSARVATVSRWADRPRRAGDWFAALGRLTAAVRCGHSYPNPVNQSNARLAMLDHRDRLPFAFRWIDGRMIVTRSLHPHFTLPAGTEIEGVDGVPSGHLLARLLPLARADGSNDGKRVALMEIDGTGRFNAFDVYRPLVAGSRLDGTVRLRVAGRQQVVPAMTDAERQAAQPKGEGEGWTFAIDQAGIGLLAMPTWALYNSKWDWRGFLDRAVDRLISERARGLVIDLRDNEGGQDIGDYLLARLIDRPIPQPFYSRYVRYRSAPQSLRPYLDTWDPSFRDWGKAAQPSDRNGFYRLVRDEDDLPGAAILPRDRPFRGKVAVLVSPTCSSATFQFANLVKTSRIAKLVGRTTGGNLRGINGGAYFFLRLPATGMEVDLPLIGYFPDQPQADTGVVPDIVIPLSRSDIALGRDRALDAAIASLS